MSLAVLILARNEEKNITACINSALFAEEIIVIDDFSEDSTVRRAEDLGAKVYQRAMNGNWGEQQTYAISRTTAEWIFFLDADERIPAALAAEIKKITTSGEKIAYKVPRLNYIMGQPLHHGGWYPDYTLRLLPRPDSYVEGFVHPQIVHPYPERRLANHLIHYTYTNWKQYFNKFNLYTELAAKKNNEKGKKAYFIRDIVLRPFVAFFKMYILKAGWLDGKIGFILAVFHFFYTMAKYVKLRQIQIVERDKGENRDF